MKILHLAAARPNFMKVAPLYTECAKDNSIEQIIVHSGQHYDPNLSSIFFDQLKIPHPNIHLEISAKNREEQIQLVRNSLSDVINKFNPDFVIVVGDVNSTLGGALATKDCNKTLVHVESGLRSFDMNMPEEINRIATDQISDLLFVTEESGLKNLKNEKIQGKAFLVGNIMIDSLCASLPQIKKLNQSKILEIEDNDYFVATFHRPANVDLIEDISELLDCIEAIQRQIKLVLPLHPRTHNSIEKFGLKSRLNSMNNLIITKPLGYMEFMNLVLNSKGIVTDSGGIQEETTFLKIPCLTIRESTERPVTVELGSNELISRNPELCKKKVNDILIGKIKDSTIPKLWDGQTAKRIKDILVTQLNS
jgi:UDP-N-acetylglucosamine 2-epimerase (non-hydrolysing)